MQNQGGQNTKTWLFTGCLSLASSSGPFNSRSWRAGYLTTTHLPSGEIPSSCTRIALSGYRERVVELLQGYAKTLHSGCNVHITVNPWFMPMLTKTYVKLCNPDDIRTQEDVISIPVTKYCTAENILIFFPPPCLHSWSLLVCKLIFVCICFDQSKHSCLLDFFLRIWKLKYIKQ